jgi:hypothetical protein
MRRSPVRRGTKTALAAVFSGRRGGRPTGFTSRRRISCRPTQLLIHMIWSRDYLPATSLLVARRVLAAPTRRPFGRCNAPQRRRTCLDGYRKRTHGNAAI